MIAHPKLQTKDEKRPEKNLLRRLFGHKRKQETGGCQKLTVKQT
jgi:hypothetical protein